MSANKVPSPGAPKPVEPESGAINSPDVQNATLATESSPAAGISSSTEPATATAPSDNTASGDTAPAAQTAAGGENVAPVQEPASSPPVSSPPAAAAQAQKPESSPMSTEEPKLGTEPSSEQSSADVEGKEVEDAGPALHITLLLTTGSRHPFTIDGKYLRKSSVNVENNDPFAMSVYTLKELIWREWRSGEFDLDGFSCQELAVVLLSKKV